MEYIQLISTIIITTALIIFAALEYIKVFQLDGYRFECSKKTQYILIKLLVISVFSTLINLFIQIVLKANAAMGFIVFTSLLLIVTLSSRIYERQKVKFTNRVIRLLVFVAILFCVVIYFLLRYAASFLPLAILLIVPIVVISNYLLFPLEAFIRYKYMKKSKLLLNKKNVIRIGITGSYGKTSVKNILYTILSEKYSVYKTPKNYNTPMGVCLSIKELKDEQVFIVEMGARNKGDIKTLCDMVHPEIGILTGITKQHLKTFKTIENIIATKRELQENLYNNQYMIYNDNNPFCAIMQNEYKGISTGISDVTYEILEIRENNQKFSFTINSKKYQTSTKLLGTHNIENILVAIKCALYLELSMDEILNAIPKIENIDNRFEIKTLSNGVTIIDDSYNSNIEGNKSSLSFLKNFNSRKIVFSQGIVELGGEQYEINKELGVEISKVADIVILLGTNKVAIKDGLISNNFNLNNIICINRFEDVKGIFSNCLEKGDVLLIQNDLTDNF